MIVHLRQEEEVILYKNIFEISPIETQEMVLFLNQEYDKESLNFPDNNLSFDPVAAIWASQLFYHASQLVLYREQDIGILCQLVRPYYQIATPNAIVSADLILRFVPQLINELCLIDYTDPIISVLEDILQDWHYSAIGYSFGEDLKLDYTTILENRSLLLLYLDRVVERNAVTQPDQIKEAMLAEVGIYAKELLPNFDWK